MKIEFKSIKRVVNDKDNKIMKLQNEKLKAEKSGFSSYELGFEYRIKELKGSVANDKEKLKETTKHVEMRTNRLSKLMEQKEKQHQEFLDTLDEIISLTLIEGQNSKATIKELAEHLKDMMLGEDETNTDSDFKIDFRGPAVPYVIIQNPPPNKDCWFYKYIMGRNKQ